ncbi:MAG: glycosyltransferase family 4 protein [Planctomycetota bacterium]|jgi:glycosyltransferase involved in cell wall biosynthesis
MMRVVIAGWLLGLGPSGANRRLLALLHALPPHLQQGESITVLHGPEGVPENPPTEVSWRRVDIPAVPAWRRARRQQKTLPKVLYDLNADVFEQGFLPIVARAPCPVSATLHDLRDLGPFARRNRWVARVAHSRSLCRVAAVAVPSRFTATELRERLGQRLPHIEVLPGGVGSEFLGYQRQQHFVEPYFLHVGHLERRKNLDMLLAAYALFLRLQGPRDEIPSLRFVGADAGEGHDLEKQAADLRITNRVRFEGQVSEPRLMEYYAGCQALLFPSLYEGFGIPALEALAMGKRVFVSDAGALPEVVGKAGTVLPRSRVDAWAEAMTSAMEPVDDLTRRHGQARAQELSWDRCAAGTLALWRRVAVGELVAG